MLPAALQFALQHQHLGSPFSSPLSTPESSPASSPDLVVAELPPTSHEPPAISTASQSVPLVSSAAVLQVANVSSSTSTRKRKRKRNDKDRLASKERRIKRRASMLPTERQPRVKLRPDPPALTTALNPPAHLPVSSTGFTGKLSEALRPNHHWTVDELKSQGFEEIQWDGR